MLIMSILDGLLLWLELVAKVIFKLNFQRIRHHLNYKHMKKNRIIQMVFFGICTIALYGFVSTMKESSAKIDPSDMELLEKSIEGASVLSFGPDNILFIGDSKKGRIYAVPTNAEVLQVPVPFNVVGVDKMIAGKLGVTSSDIIINDMQIHPVSQEAYIAVKNGHAPSARSLIAVISPSDNEVRFLDLSDPEIATVSIKDPRKDDFNFWRNLPATTFNITDIDYHDGYVYAAGLTNGDFASTLRKIKYPFDGTQDKVAGIEMYHAVHTQMETRAPIRTMTFAEVNGEPTLIAAYTCTPLVSIPASQINEGEHIKAKTVAELGYGNTPIDMITFMAQEMDGSFDRKLLIINKERSASVISMKDFAKANLGEGLTAGKFTWGPEGVQTFPVPLGGAMQISEQNAMMLTVLRRNMDTGEVDLLSELKGMYFRLSDFQSEYNFPDYDHNADVFKNEHNMMKKMEGYSELMVE